MFAKVIGSVTALAVFFLYFAAIGTEPVLETLLGVILALAAGVGAWWETRRRLRRGGDGPG